MIPAIILNHQGKLSRHEMTWVKDAYMQGHGWHDHYMLVHCDWPELCELVNFMVVEGDRSGVIEEWPEALSGATWQVEGDPTVRAEDDDWPVEPPNQQPPAPVDVPDPPLPQRYCKIESASIEEINGGGDGAYDLLGISGSPEEIGRAIGESLKEADMSRGPVWCYIEDGDDELYLNVRIRFARHPLEPLDDEEGGAA